LQPNFFNTLFIIPILNLLIAFYKAIQLVGIPGAFGFSIIVFTLSVRLLLHPFFKQQMDTAKKMQEMKPHLDRLTEKHKNDKQKLQEEQLKLYQQAGVNPAGGCLTMLIQMPIFIGLYQTLNFFLTANNAKTIAAINKVLYAKFFFILKPLIMVFWINLITTPEKAGHILYFIVPVITGFFSYSKHSLQWQHYNNNSLKRMRKRQKIKKKTTLKIFKKQ
jgi:YidC/Oxa1 family membrane protein insertase